jgi:hypothetical protein
LQVVLRLNLLGCEMPSDETSNAEVSRPGERSSHGSA